VTVNIKLKPTMKTLALSIPLLLMLAAVPGCYEGAPWHGIEGQGPVVERRLDLDRFEGLTLPGSAKIFLTQDNHQEVRIEGQENIIDNLNTTISGGIWRIENKKPVWRSEPLLVYISMEQLRLVRISGSGNIRTTNRFSDLRNLEIKISGSGDMDLEIEANDILAQVSGSGNVNLKGSAKDLDFGISGSGSIRAGDLKARKAIARISGSGGMELFVTDELDAHISGSGNIYYSGNPDTHKSVSGSGHVRSR